MRQASGFRLTHAIDRVETETVVHYESQHQSDQYSLIIKKAASIYLGAQGTFKCALCAEVIRLRVSYNQNDKTLSRNSLRYLSKANLTIAVH